MFGDKRNRWACLLTVLLLVGSPTLAGDVELEMDPDNPNPDDGKDSGDKWNPTYVCVSEPGDTMLDLYLCLVGGIADSQGACIPAPVGGGSGDVLQSNHGIGDCDADPQDREDWELRFPFPYGFQIVPVSSNPEPDVQRLVLWENHSTIMGVRLAVPGRTNMVARIAPVEERPAADGGIVTVTVDEYTVTIDTDPLKKASDVTDAIFDALNVFADNPDMELDVLLHGGFIYVMRDLINEVGVNEVSFHSTDPDIVSTDLALLPIEETGLVPEPQN